MHYRKSLAASLLAVVLSLCSNIARADDAADKLIPRNVLFGNPDRRGLQISHDGKQISFLAPSEDVMNIWVAPADNIDAAKVVTHDKKRGISTYFWAFNNTDLIYLQDANGDENWAVHQVNLASGEDKTLTPTKGVNARLDQVSDRHPDEILVQINDRNPMFHDLHKIDLKTGKDTLVLQNPGTIDGNMVAGLVADEDYNPRFASVLTEDGGSRIYKPKDAKDLAAGWEKWIDVPMEDTLSTGPAGFDKTGQVVYFRDSRGRDTAALYALDLNSGEKKLIAEDPKADAGQPIRHPTEKTPQAVSFTYEKSRWQVLDPALQADFDYLNKEVADNGEAEFSITSRTLDDKTWIVAVDRADAPAKYYRYNRDAKKTEFLFVNNKKLADQPLAKMHPVLIKSRDGLDLVSYYTLPKSSDSDGDGKPDHPLPMVLYVHGGPWGRDTWGYNPVHQWLANRGYAVLSVNFRGSTGFGKGFVNAGNKEWGAKMHNDLLDAVEWATKEAKIAEPGKVAIMGASYGGYATLAGLTMTPDAFACGVDICGPSRLVTLLNSVPPYWKPALKTFTTRVGDNSSEAGKQFLDSRSPLTFVDKISKPLLIGQGANDPRVKQAEADQIVKAMQEKNLPVTYVVYSDEGHGFARPENRMSFFAVTEAFLKQNLGGRCEPVSDDFKNSTINIKAGAEQIRGLKDQST